MADKRKSFRARRLAFGRHSLPRLCIIVSLALAAPAVHAQEVGLKSGAESLAAGKYEDAVRQLTAAINTDNVSTRDAAKALYLRGIAYRKTGQPARAVADLGAAIWLGLPQSDRVKALVNKGLAFKAAGLNRQGEAEIASARKIGGNSQVDKVIAEDGAPSSAAAIASRDTSSSSSGLRSWLPSFGRSSSNSEPAAPTPPASPAPRTASAAPQQPKPANKPPPATGSWETSVEGAGQESSSSSGGNRLTRWFGSFGGSSSSESPPPAPGTQTAASPPPPAPGTQTAAASPPPSRARSTPPAAAASSSWSTTTQSEGASSSETSSSESRSGWRIFNRSAETAPPAQPAAARSASGGYRLQLANSRSQAEAQALWKKASRTQGVRGVTPQIEKIDIGDFGTFYSLKIGPFPDKAQSVKVCNALKRSGIDCSPVTL